MFTEFDRGDTTVALAGDWHGNINWVQKAIPFARRSGIRTIYQVGDLGFWGERPGTGFRATLEFWLTQADINLVVTPGNHEDWVALDKLFAEDPGQPLRLEPHVWVLPRGYRWSHGSRSFVSLGGAPSIDLEYRTPLKSWWPSEAITDADVDTVVAGGHAEIMLVHDAPSAGTEAVRNIRETSDTQGLWSVKALAYADDGMHKLDRAVTGVQPRLLVHGHFHVQDSIVLESGLRVVSMGSDGGRGNLALLNLETMDVTWIEPGRR
jgi:hypothetical protein